VADVRFDAAAITDVTLARDWYEGECVGLGVAFVDSVEATARRIGRFPGAGSSVFASLRRQFVERFPYVLYYREADSGILVVACLHVARGPEYEVRRLSG
jgi:toxin ParE1/3/4